MSEQECARHEETIESAGEDACLQDFDGTTPESHDVAISDVTAQQNDISQRGVVPNADGDEIDIFVGQDIGPEASLVSEAASEESGIALPEIEDVDEKLSEGEASPPSEDSLGRRKRKPSRYHDSMFDIPTNLLNINRTINPEEFRAFHSKGQKQKEKGKKPAAVPAFIKASKAPKLETVSDDKVSPYGSPAESPATYSDFEDDALDPSNMFKFKMRKDHIIQNVCGGPTAYKCDICLMSFPRSFSLRRHYTRRHINPKYVAARTESATGNAEPSDSQEDADLYGEDQEKYLYACKMCSRTLIYFKHKNELHVHCLENHTTEPRRPVSLFKCDICRRPYSTRHELERHKRTHSGERPYQCGYCDKTFPTSTNARRHERTHTGDRPHTCKICNKGFIQRTDMVKHLRSMHKMKVTKTKAQKSGFTNEGKHTKNGGGDGSGRVFETDKSNEFQENIDFAAYLKLDQHISGTLMGEGVSNYSGKDAASNGNKNGNSPAKTTNLRDLPPSQIMGEDGKMEKIHKCPECSKMFTSNINLRRHYKLKHERNQIYQSAEPVSMVVEKYKMMDDGSPNISKEDKANGEKGNTSTLPARNDNVDNKDEDEASKAIDSTEHQESIKDEIRPAPTITPAKKEIKPGKHSKLSSIVQRLASKINAEKFVTPEDKDSTVVLTPEKEPISQLEELGNQIFADATPPNESASPKRNKRKPSSVQHVPTKDPADETPRGIPKHKSMIPDNYKQNIRKQQASSRTEKEPGSIGGIYRKVLDTATHPRPSVEQRKTEYGVFTDRERYGRLSSSCRAADNMRDTPVKSNQFADLSQRTAPYQSRPGSRDRHHPGAPVKRQDASRIETFLSQCYSSRKCDVPQNAILDRNVPVRDSNSANRKLKYNMKHFTIERSNEHLPAAAYFSRRDPGFSPDPKNESTPEVAPDKNWAENDCPLDLRVQCKRDAPGYVVRDDGVLDFSQKTRDSVTKGKPHADSPGPRPTVQNPPRVKTEPRKNAAVFSDRRYPEPYSRPYPEEIPPWGNRQKYIDRDACQPPHPTADHRRDLIHGRPSSSKPGKPYKFHCVDFKPPVPRGPVVIDSKGRMQQSFRSYRDHPYPIPRGGQLMGRRGYTPTNAYLPPTDDPRSYLTDRIMPGQMQRKHLPHGSQYSPHTMATPRYTHARDSLPSYPAHRPNHNWPVERRRDPRFAPFDQSSPGPGNLRPILPKGDWSADVLSKSAWKDDPRPIPSSIQRLAMKKSQGPSPFDRWDIFDDRDMMNRCIKKAQQSLHNEPASDSIKRAKSETFDRNSAAYKTSQSISSYIKKINSDRSRGREKHFAMAPGTIKPRVPRFIPGTSDVGVRNQAMTQKADAGPGMFEMLNLTSSMRSSYAKRDDLQHNEHPKETVKREPEPSHEEISDREKLTMTPGLESNHDVSESNLTKAQDGDTTDEAHVTEDLRRTSADDQKPEIAPDSVPMDLVKCNPTSSGATSNENLTPKSEIFEGFQFSGKLVNRRHTQAHPGEDNLSSNDEEASADPKRGLKRTCSNDSNPGDSLSDEGDASSRKLIKKLKLRVIKSSGSERKKYWTLVEHDGPMRLTTTNSPEPETLVDGEDKTDMEVAEPSEPCDCAVVSDKLNSCDDKVEEFVDDKNSVEPPSQDEEMVSDPVSDDVEKESIKGSEKDSVQEVEMESVKQDTKVVVNEVETDSVKETGTESLKQDKIEMESVKEAEKDLEQHVEKEPETALLDAPQTTVPETNIELQTEDIETPREPEVENKSTLNIIMTGNQVETALTAIKTDIADDAASSGESETDSPENAPDLDDTDAVTERVNESDTPFPASDPIDMLPEELFYSTTTEENDHANMEFHDEDAAVSKTDGGSIKSVLPVAIPASVEDTVDKSDETQNSESTGSVLPRKTRSGGVPKAAKPVESEMKNSENIPATKVASVAELAANRLRRSVRIRKTSSDKDAAAKKKK